MATQSSQTDMTSATVYEIKKEQLPLCCPMPGINLWNAHPKVYLPIGESNEVKCPYCGTVYRLV